MTSTMSATHTSGEEVTAPAQLTERLAGLAYAISQLTRMAAGDPGVLAPIADDLEEAYLLVIPAAEHVQLQAELAADAGWSYGQKVLPMEAGRRQLFPVPGTVVAPSSAELARRTADCDVLVEWPAHGRSGLTRQWAAWERGELGVAPVASQHADDRDGYL